MLITNGTLVQSGIRRRTIQRQVSFGPVTLKVVTLIIFAAAAVIALGQTTASATKNYVVHDLESSLAQRQVEVQDAQTEATRLNALKQVLATSQPSPNPNAPSASPSLAQPSQINYLPPEANSDLSQGPQRVALP